MPYGAVGVRVPLPELLAALGEQRAHQPALTGDDYELCFAVPPRNFARLHAQLPLPEWRYTRSGLLRAAPGAVVLREGTVMEFSHSGYAHFA